MSKCPVCEKRVYAMEEIKIEGISMHKTCFRCSVCKRTLNGSNFAKNHGIYYCKVHFQQMFREKGNYDEGFGHQKHSADWGKQTVKKEEPKPAPKAEPKVEPKPVAKPEPKPEVKKEEPKKEVKEEPKVVEPPKPVEWKMSEETKKLLDGIVAGLDKLEKAVEKVEKNGVAAAPAQIKNEEIDNVFARLDAVLAKLEQK